MNDGRKIRYVRKTTKLPYNEAERWCFQWYGHLPIPTSQQENDWLADIGSTWLAVNTQYLKKLTYSNFKESEPSGDADTVHLISEVKLNSYGGFWHDGTGKWPTTCYLDKEGKRPDHSILLVLSSQIFTLFLEKKYLHH